MSENKNDKLFILEGNVNDSNVQNLVMAFREELKPMAVTVKTWGKANL